MKPLSWATQKTPFKTLFELRIVPLFVLLAYLDYIVHDVLYSYGLQFSFAWATPYWTVYSLIFLSVCILSKSYLGLLLFLGQFQDLIMFMGFSQDFSARLWTWTPYYLVLGLQWNVYTQLIFCITIVTAGLAVKHWRTR